MQKDNIQESHLKFNFRCVQNRKVYKSVQEAATDLSLNPSKIRKVLKDGGKACNKQGKEYSFEKLGRTTKWLFMTRKPN